MKNTPEQQGQEKIAIVTDSTCDLSPELITKYGIEVLPLHILYKDREYLDRVNITPDEVYANMETEIPTTSLPSLAEINDLFTKLRNDGITHIVSIHISSGLSGTFNAVSAVAQDFKDMVIEVVDSKTLSLGLGLSVLEAARARQDSLNFQRVVDVAKSALKEIKAYYVLSTLEYLKRGGRIGYVSGTIGELLSIKPIISLNEEGKYFTFAKVRGRDASLRRLAEVLTEHIREKISNVAIVHGGSEAEARELLAKAKEMKNIKELFFSQVSPAMGVHTGPGLVGFLVYPCLKPQP